MRDPNLTRSQAFEESENVGRNDSTNPSIGDIIALRFDRRDISQRRSRRGRHGCQSARVEYGSQGRGRARTARFTFAEVTAGSDEKHYVAADYDADVLIRWGDSVLPGAPAFDPMKQTADGQKRQFGYNNDFIGYLAMPGAANPARHGLLVVNHEYTNEETDFLSPT